MRFENYLNEYYMGLAKGIKGLVEPKLGMGFPMFVNPTPKELKEFGEELGGLQLVRFIANDKTKKLYVSSLGCYHPEFFRWLKHEGLVSDIKDCLAGSGSIENGKINLDETSYELATPKNIKRFVWLDKYFTNFNKLLGVKEYVDEEYVDQLTSSIRLLRGGKYETYEVFVNPTKNELVGMKRLEIIRGLIDMKQKKLFVFDGNSDIHEYAWKKLKSKGYISDKKYLYRLAGWVEGYKIRSSDFESYPFNTFLNKEPTVKYKPSDFDWLKPYLKPFVVKNLIELNNEFPDVAYIDFRNVNEEYVATGKGLDDTGMRDKTVGFPIYKNPGSSDYKELRKTAKDKGIILLRAIADLKNKNLFVWNALLGVHIEGFNALKQSGDIKLEPDSAYNLFCGSGDLYPGKNKLTHGAEFLSFIEYIRYYGLDTTKPFEGTIEDIKKKAEWLKSYYTGNITVENRWGSPKIEIL